MARLFTFAAVVVSLTGFIGGEAGASGWWPYAVTRAGYVLAVLAVVAALLSARTPNVLVAGAQVLAAAAALAFEIVALVKYYDSAGPFGFGIGSAFTWAGEAEMFGVAALAFALTLARRRSTFATAGLAVAVAIAAGCAIYALTLEENLSTNLWWSIAGVGAFLAASAAAGLERGYGIALRAPIAGRAGGIPGSDPGIE